MNEQVCVFPCSFGQERLWFLDRLFPASALYVAPVALPLDGPVDPPVLERALNEIVRRHEALRTTFLAVDGEPFQVVAPQLHLPLPLVDLRPLPDKQRTAEARRIATEQAQAPFDLAHGPLLRATLLHRADHRFVLLLAMHHIVTDGWSMRVLLSELTRLYDAFAHDQPSPLPELGIQYPDFALWQRSELQGPALDRLLAWWRHTLRGLPVLELPADRPRPPVASLAGASITTTLPPALAGRLRALARHHHATLFMALLAGYVALLDRTTGHDDVVVGSPIAGRTRAETDELIGFFVNTLVLRVDCSGNPSFAELLGRVRTVALGAFAHQDLPFEQLVAELAPQRDLSRNPLFQTIFQLIERADASPNDQLRVPVGQPYADADPGTGTGAHTGSDPYADPDLTPERGTAAFDLAVDVWDAPRGLSMRWEYRTDLFDAQTISRLATRYRRLLEGAVGNPDCRLSELPLLTDEEHGALLQQGTGPTTVIPDRCVHELVADQARRTPEAVAVSHGTRTLTYADLDHKANRLAHRLQAAGVGPERLVAVLAPRSVELVVALLGVLKAGGAYLPLDPADPPARLTALLDDAAPALLLHPPGAELPSGFPSLALDLKDLGDPGHIDDSGGAAGADPPPTAVSPANLAYVIYTSGSTGAPKGVEVEHRSLVNHVLAVAHRFALEPGDRVLQLAPARFDVAAEEIFPTWVHGATLVLGPEPMPLPAALIEQMSAERVSVLNLSTSYWRSWFATLASGAGLAFALTTLRLVIIGSERTPSDAVAWWRELVRARVRLLHAYGVSEATITSLLSDLGCGQEAPGGHSAPLGHPIPNTEAHVLDPHGHLVPPGVPGELHLAGAGLARGYRHRPALTAERFVPHPFRSGARLYRTGDRVLRRPDGSLEFLGRTDDQIKLRGFRIEPAEVEAALGSHPGVGECVVVARHDPPAGPRLVAYVSSQPQHPVPDTASLRRHAATTLPAFMVPAQIVVVPALPRTPHGKIDRRALPAPPAGRPDDLPYRAPARALERAVAAIWQEVLGLDRVGAEDNFFDLGGQSLLLVQVHARIVERLGAELSIIDLFQHPTVRALAALLDGRSVRRPSRLAPEQRASRQRSARRGETLRKELPDQ